MGDNKLISGEMSFKLDKNSFVLPVCPNCDKFISGVVGSDNLRCDECNVYWRLELIKEDISE
jgi:hypothetical protein